MVKVKEWADKHLQGDKVIWAVVFTLSLISILVVYSSIGTLAFKRSESPEKILFTHTLHLLIGLAAMWFAHKVDYRYYSKLSRFALLISIPLLLYTFVAGVNVNDARRWINIVGFSFQPSDFASLALIVNLASMLSKRQQNIDDIKESLIPILFWCGIICGLIGLTNMSTAILLLATCMLIMFIGRVPTKYLAMLFFVGILFGSLAFMFGTRGGTMVARAKQWYEYTITGKGEPQFQSKHGFIAVSTGGLTGKGPGNSDQRAILPNPFADFVFAIYVEEYGLIGAVVLIGLYLLLLHRGMKAAYNSERAFGGLLSAGLCFDLVSQAFINMGVVVGLGPVTGQPLPLVSMGGTSAVFTGLALGIVLSVSRGEQDDVWEKKGGSAEAKETKNVATPKAA
jgi:cell division protein FtsW